VVWQEDWGQSRRVCIAHHRFWTGAAAEARRQMNPLRRTRAEQAVCDAHPTRPKRCRPRDGGLLLPLLSLLAGHTIEGGTPSGRKGRMPSPRRVALDRSERKAVGSRQWRGRRQWGRILNYKLSVLAAVSTVRRNWGSLLSRRSTLRRAWGTAA